MIKKIHIIQMMLLSTVLLSSCGTLLKKNEFVIIDTKSRHLKFQINDSKISHYSPSITEAPKGIFHQVHFLELNQSRALRCQFDFKHSILPNALTSIIIPIIGVTSFVIDFVTDNDTVCDARYFYEFDEQDLKEISKKNKDKSNALASAKIIQLPFHQSYRYDLDLLEKNIIKNTSQNLTLVKYQDTIGDFYLEGIEEQNISWKKFNPKLFLKVAKNHQATHYAIHQVKYKNNQKYIETKIYDLFNFTKIKKHHQNNYLINENSNILSQDNLFTRFLDKVSIMPNSANYDQKSFKQTNQDLEIKHAKSIIPEALSRFSLNMVNHPSKYLPFDFDFNLGPTLSFPSFDLKNKSNDEYNNDVLEVSSIAATFSLTATIHTPIGAISSSVSLFGATYLKELDSSNKQNTEMTNFNSYRLDYTFFISPRVYFKLSKENLQFSDYQFKVGDEKINEVTYDFLSIGYFYPELGHWFKI